MPRRTIFLLCWTFLVSGADSALAALEVTSPARGEKWSIGSLHYVTWSGGPASPAAVVEYSPDAGKTWIKAGDAAAGASRLKWQVPTTTATELTLRVTIGTASTSQNFAIIPSQEVTDYAWVNVTQSAAFAGRDGAGALTFAGKMWFLGGWNPGNKKVFPRICNNEVWNSVDGATWMLVKPNTFLDAKFDAGKDWEGRHTAGYVVHRDKMWIVGGDVNQGHYQSDVWNSADGAKWTQVNAGKPVPWGPRALHYTVAHRDKIWVIGGQTMPAFSSSKEVFYRDVWNSADGVTWHKVEIKEPTWPQRGMIGGAAVFQDRIWILGGGTYDTPSIPKRKFFHDVWSSADGATWTRHVESAPWEPRQYHDVAVYDNRLWVMEGYSEGVGNRNDVWYSADGVNWYDVPKTPWSVRHAASVYVHSGALWMVAGNNMTPDVWKLTRKPRK